ncbi:gamma-glutamyltransferase family protein [Rhodoligotrophos ferricapiens]|uniref:gamma-glutamyltransferase family protein n=1 Tax=Rhodoligotrophos ferricapiens TaxID=3069264 RepID=UPI00315D086C
MKIGWPWLSLFEPHPDLAAFRPVIGESGMVSSPHATASRIGLDILRRGGNAVDAAIATSAALMVICPMQCGPGGDAFWMIASRDGRIHALDASGRAAMAANADDVHAAGFNAIPMRSGFSVTTPGAVDGWAKAHAKFGSLPLSELLEPAAALAEHGFIASRHAVASYRTAEPELREKQALACLGVEAMPSLYGKVCQPALARTLRDIGASAGRTFYEGPLASAIARAVRQFGGWLDEADLAACAAEWVEPISAPFRKLTVFTTPPSTQGFGLLAALCRIEAVSSGPLDRHDPAAVHLLIEATAAALDLRDRYNQDRKGVPAGLQALWEEPAASTFAQTYDPSARSALAARPSHRVTKGDTAHLAVCDANGMCVSLIQSLFFDFGSCIPVQEGGFTLQNRGAAFHLNPEEAGALAPGIRPPSTLMPSIATIAGTPVLTSGCMGGDGQIQTQLQLLIDITDGGLDPQQAISRPRWYLDRSGADSSLVKVEAGVERSIVEGLRARGHLVEVLGPSEEIMGHAQVIQRVGSVLVGGADPRSDGQVAAC